MSTVDSLLLLSSSAVVRDAYQKMIGTDRDEDSLAFQGKILTVVIGVLAVLGGIQQPRVIFDFVLASWSGLGAAFGPVVIFILYYKRITWAGVLAGMIAGFGVNVIWLVFFKADYHNFYEAIPGFAAGILFTWLISWMTSKKT